MLQWTNHIVLSFAGRLKSTTTITTTDNNVLYCNENETHISVAKHVSIPELHRSAVVGHEGMINDDFITLRE